MKKAPLFVFSPLPPERNGIADYTAALLERLTTHFRCGVFAAPQSMPMPGIDILDPLQDFRLIGPKDHILHQIGNNPGHIFVLEALRRWGGVTTLHDQNLHYLYETMGSGWPTVVRGMTATSASLGARFAEHWRQHGIKTGANYVLFDMLHEVLSLSSAVVVHSSFARTRIELLYGADLSRKVHVIPHLSLPVPDVDPTPVRDEYGVPPGTPLIVTAGFATAAKRFDWLAAALDEVARQGSRFVWIHAGEERPEEFDLSGLLRQYPGLADRVRITGYLTEDGLNRCIGACDILVNLRFPSVGESSGTLARAMTAGRCCIVSATAAYADLPPDTVVRTPVVDPVRLLTQSLRALLDDGALRDRIGHAAQTFAASAWDPEGVAKAYARLLDGTPRATGGPATRTTVARARRQIEDAQGDLHLDGFFAGVSGSFEVALDFDSIDLLAKVTLETDGWLAEVLPPGIEIESVRFERRAGVGEPGGALTLRLAGTCR